MRKLLVLIILGLSVFGFTASGIMTDVAPAHAALGDGGPDD